MFRINCHFTSGIRHAKPAPAISGSFSNVSSGPLPKKSCFIQIFSCVEFARFVGSLREYFPQLPGMDMCERIQAGEMAPLTELALGQCAGVFVGAVAVGVPVGHGSLGGGMGCC